MESKTEFAVFCIENLAKTTGIPAQRVYRLLTEDTDLLTGYILPCCDVLHTQSRDYIVNDLIEALHEKGVAV